MNELIDILGTLNNYEKKLTKFEKNELLKSLNENQYFKEKYLKYRNKRNKDNFDLKIELFKDLYLNEKLTRRECSFILKCSIKQFQFIEKNILKQFKNYLLKNPQLLKELL